MDDIEFRLKVLEEWRRGVDATLVELNVDKGYINRRFDGIEQELKEIKSTAKQLTYAVASAAIIYLVTFIMNGGLAVLKTGVN